MRDRLEEPRFGHRGADLRFLLLQLLLWPILIAWRSLGADFREALLQLLHQLLVLRVLGEVVCFVFVGSHVEEARVALRALFVGAPWRLRRRRAAGRRAA